MNGPAVRPTSRRLRPMLVGLFASVFAFWALYAIVLLVVLALPARD